MHKYTEFVRITKGPYAGHLGMVVEKIGSHIHGIPGEHSEEVYEIMLVIGKRVIAVEDKDLKTEIIQELKEQQMENQEALENPEEVAQEAIENPEEAKEAELENKGENSEKR